MRFQFLKSIFAGVKATLLRFPLPVVMTIVATVAANYIVSLDGSSGASPQIDTAMRIIRTCFLGFPLALAIVLFLEKNKVPNIFINLCRVVLIGLLLLYYFTLPGKLTVVDDVRFVLLTLAAHLMVSFLPFIDRNDNNGFWQYNRMLFMRLLTGLLYSVVLYMGLALALQALNSLFGVHFDNNNFVRLWIYIIGIFNSLFLLAGIPANIGNLRHEYYYPKGLKIFAQFVLLPLVAVYLLILYSYSVKILLQWEWPQGWVSYLVLGFAITGIFSFLLIEPIKHQQGNAWIKIYSKVFYIALFPLVVVLFLAVRIRINEYGITENRYFLIGLAIWLAAIAIYFLVSKKKNIKIIPITLFALTLLSIIGPWNAFNVAERSQMRIFDTLVERNRLLNSGKFTAVTKAIPLEDNRQLSSVVKFLHDRERLDLLQAYFDAPVDVIASKQHPESQMADMPENNLMRAMGLPYVDRWYTTEAAEMLYFTKEMQEVKVVSGYDLSLRYNSQDNIVQEDTTGNAVVYEYGGKSYVIESDSLFSRLYVYCDDSLLTEFDIEALSNKLRGEYKGSGELVPATAMTLQTTNGKHKFMLSLEHVTLRKQGEEEKYQVVDVDANLLISL
jgi:hypothetical protein